MVRKHSVTVIQLICDSPSRDGELSVDSFKVGSETVLMKLNAFTLIMNKVIRAVIQWREMT